MNNRAGRSLLVALGILVVVALIYSFAGESKGGGHSEKPREQEHSSPPNPVVGDDNKSDLPKKETVVPSNAKVPEPVVYDMAAAAESLGLKSRGPVDAALREIIVARLARGFEGSLKELGSVVGDDMRALKLTADILKFQLASDMFAKGRYITTDPIAKPKKMPKDHDVLMLWNAGALNGEPVGVVFLMSLAENEQIKATMETIAMVEADHLDSYIANFNLQTPEQRTPQIQDWLEAQRQITDATRAQRNGEITLEQLRERLDPWLSHRPPPGVIIDRATNSLRRGG